VTALLGKWEGEMMGFYGTSLCLLLLAACLCAVPIEVEAEMSNRAGSVLENPFFAMDTGTRDDAHRSPQAQADMLEELGYAGIGYSGFAGLKEMLDALDAHGLKLFTIYISAAVEPEGYTIEPGFEEALGLLKGRDTFIWITITSKTYQPSSVDGDAQAVAMLRHVADLAKPAGVRVALYPHSWAWLERVDDAVRVAQKVDRDNVGATFNLCHWLRVEKGADMRPTLASAMPRLFVVTINGADHEGDWDRLIQTLDRGDFDVASLLRALQELGYRGPIGLQGYGIGGDVYDNLERSMTAWRGLVEQVSAGATDNRAQEGSMQENGFDIAPFALPNTPPEEIRFEEPRDIDHVVVDLDGNIVDGDLKASSDTASHLYIYRHMPEVNGVVHTHSNYATAFAALGKAIPPVLTAIGDEFGGPIPCGGFALIGGEEIGKVVVESIGHSPACLLKNHGVFTVGPTGDKALKAAVMVEDVAKTVWIALQIGTPDEISATDIDKLYDRYTNVYGQ